MTRGAGLGGRDGARVGGYIDLVKGSHVITEAVGGYVWLID